MTQENEELTLKLMKTVQEWFIVRRVQYKIIRTSLTQMQLTLIRITGSNSTIRQEQLRQLEISTMWKKGVGLRIARKPPPYVIIARSQNYLKFKMVKKPTRYHPYRR